MGGALVRFLLMPQPKPCNGLHRCLDGQLGGVSHFLIHVCSPTFSHTLQVIALEYVCATAAPDRLKELPLMLKAMYDEDLADDEIILAWAGKADAAKALGVDEAAAAAARAAAAPVIEWLEESEDEE